MNQPVERGPLINRRSATAVATALGDTRVVLVTGPRQAGKTTLVRQFVTDERPYLTLDDLPTLQLAREDPTSFIRGLRGAVIDEIQRAPELMMAIKVSVDRDPLPGRFLLTGSANVMALPTIGDSLAGRLENVSLFPFSQSELAGTAGTLIDRLFAGELPVMTARPPVGDALVDLVLAGGYPSALARAAGPRRTTWHDDYLAMILDRDVRDIASIEQLDKLPVLVRLLAEQVGQLTNLTNVATALQMSRPTVSRYIQTLERLFLIRTVPPWYSNRISRLIKAPKIHFLDSGLLAARLGLDKAALRATPARYGPLLESFAAGELIKLIDWSQTRATLSHFRTKDQDEVDFVIEDKLGRVIGIEIKSTATLRRDDFSGLRKLEEAAGNRFVRGLILHDHDQVTPVSEKLHAAPLSLLWTM
ncbi:MAG: hypothetical protein RL367_1557 [Pseudomonadota bacterium]